MCKNRILTQHQTHHPPYITTISKVKPEWAPTSSSYSLLPVANGRLCKDLKNYTKAGINGGYNNYDVPQLSHTLQQHMTGKPLWLNYYDCYKDCKLPTCLF